MLTFYLLRSFRRRPMRHISLVWILLCAFILPLVVSIYRDSLVYGVQLQDFDFHKGQAIHISGGQPEDAALFQGLDGLTEPYYEDGIIYMTYDSEESKIRYSDVHESLALETQIKSIISKNNRNMEAVFYGLDHDPFADEYMVKTLRNMQLMNLALLLFSGLIVQAAYRNHIDGFSEELADISALGATKGQIIRMFLTEFLLLFPLASAGAIGISYAVMRLLYEKYLGNTAASVAIWRVFHMDAKNTALQIGFYLLVCMAAMVFSLRKKTSRLPVAKPKKATSLPRLWMQRTKTPFVSCLCILIPLLTAFVILFNQYLGTYADMVYSSEEARIYVVSTTAKGVSSEAMDSISKITGVHKVAPHWDSSDPVVLEVPNYGAILVSMHPLDELSGEIPALGKDQFIADFPDDLEIDGECELYRIMNSGKRLPVKLAKRIAPEDKDQSTLIIYVSSELIQELGRICGYSALDVFTPASQASQVEEHLRAMFSDSALISNYQNYVETTILQQEGHLWLLSWIFGILMIVAMQIVWIRLSKYIQDCAPMLRIIQQVGASQKQLFRLIPVRCGAIPASVLPFLVAIPWAQYDSYRNARPFIVSVPVIGIYLLIALLAVITFLLPVKLTMKKILK